MKLQLHTLGRSAALVRDRAVGPSADLLFAGILVFSLQSGRDLARGDVADLLWPDASPSRKGARLRWLLNRFKSIGLPLEATATHVSLPTEQVNADYLSVETVQLESIGPVLPGYAPDFSAPFVRWLDDKRDVICTEVLRQLLPRLVAAARADDWNLAMRLGAAIQRIDPLNEEAALTLAEAQCRLGSKAQALIQLEAYINAIGDDRSELRLPAIVLQRRIRNAQVPVLASEPRFIGRETEMGRIVTLVTAAQGGAGGALLVSGAVGIGKTRLVNEAIARSAVGGIQVARVRCRADGAGLPLSGVVDLVPEILALRGAVGASPSNYSHLSSLAQAAADARTGSGQLSPAMLDPTVCAAMIDVLDAASAERPVAIVVDDLQWSDQSASWLWAQLAAWCQTHPVALLFAFRLSPSRRPILKVPTISLACLDTSAAGTLADELLARVERPSDASVKAALLDRGAGSPLFLRELVRHWSLIGSTDQVPGSLVGVLEAGLCGLSAAAARALDVAAVLGTRATVDRMNRVMQLPRGVFVNAMVELETAGILGADSSGKICGHLLWSNAVLKLMSPSTLRILRGYAAETIDREPTIDPSLRLLQDLARNWELAGHLDRAVTAADRRMEQVAQYAFPGRKTRIPAQLLDALNDPSSPARRSHSDDSEARSNSRRSSFIIAPRRS